MADNIIEPISHLEKVITGDVEPISHLEHVIALYGGGSSAELDEKIEALQTFLEMPTHTGTTKEQILKAFRWFWNFCIEESE